MEHRDTATLEGGLDRILRAPRDAGTVELIVRRPSTEERESVSEARLEPDQGLVGDNWRARGSRSTADGSAHPEMQLTMMSARAAALIAGDRDRWQLAGDQLYVDLDLSRQNLPPGTRLEVGEATIEITDEPHTGCGKFVRRFGVDAMRFVNTERGRALNLRGIYARIVTPAVVRVGDPIRKV
ncbi:MAG: MOSC domain-containing protein [Actinobacteria bacterium]|nr:MOSC domain-containing protein [Actinomycetota bacterium]